MPRQQSEAAHYLNIYKLTVEKRRLKQELDSLDKRRKRIQERLQLLEQQVESLEDSAQRLREPVSASEPSSVIYPPMGRQAPADRDDFRTITLDY